MPPVTYYKRHRMELALPDELPPADLPDGFRWLPWDDRLIAAHAEVKARCFAGELDAEVFPNLGCLSGCHLLMRAIRDADGFCPAATWLLAGPDGGVGTVQGLIDEAGMGAVQNLGVVPAYRGRGLGEALILRALHGFRAAGVRRAALEVTARNAAAVRLYRRLGFRSYKTVYRAVERPDPLPVAAWI
jgi:ribosomal protein S18 acetylase RimI-like enzyme